MILACGLVFKWRGAKHESGGFHNFQHISAYFILATTKKTLQPSQIWDHAIHSVGGLSKPAPTVFIWCRLLAASRQAEEINEHVDPDITQRDGPVTWPAFVASCNATQKRTVRHGGSVSWNIRPRGSADTAYGSTNSGPAGTLGGAAGLETTLQGPWLTRLGSRSCFVDCPDGYGMTQALNLRL